MRNLSDRKRENKGGQHCGRALGIKFIHAETGKWMEGIGKAVKNINNHF